MAQFQTGRTHNTTRASRGRAVLLSRPMGDQIEGRHLNEKPGVRPEPALIRQKHPPVSIQDAKPGAEKSDSKTKVKCRQAIRAGQPQTIPLTQARGKFQSHQLKCQNCQHRMLCATA